MFDSGGDGICCDKGFGVFRVLLGDIYNKNIVFSGGHLEIFGEYKFIFDESFKSHIVNKNEDNPDE